MHEDDPFQHEFVWEVPEDDDIESEIEGHDVNAAYTQNNGLG